jgi:predicted transcriptional regulator
VLPMESSLPRSPSSFRAQRFLPLVLALVAVSGLSGSTVPQRYTYSGPSAIHFDLVTGTVSEQGLIVGSPQASVPGTTSSVSATYPVNPYGSEQLATWAETEGMLYEDYRSRRSRVLICVEIAKRLSAEPMALTDVALHVRLNFTQAKTCIEQMMVAGLVELDPAEGVKKYALTRQGLLFLESGEKTLRLFLTGSG